MHYFILSLALLISTVGFGADAPKPAAPVPVPAPEPIEYKISGLFCEASETDFRNVFKGDAAVSVAKVSFQDATATLVYQPAKLPLGDLNNRLKAAGFEIKKQLTVIPIAGLDCKACSNAVYNMLMRTEGVDQATASFKDKRATAWFDPLKTNRAALVKMLRSAEVDVTEPPEAAAKK